jgi:hypothetical protein
MITLGSPIIGLVEIGFLAGGLVALYFAASLRKYVWLLLVAKPLIDLTWRWRFFTVAEQGVNFQSLVGVLAIAVTGLALLLWGKQLVLDIKVILFLGLACFSVVLTPTSGGLNELVRLLAGISFFFLAGTVLNKESSFDRFATYFVLIVGIPAVLAILQRAHILPFDYWDWIDGQRTGRATGTYQHPLGFVYYLIYAIPLALYLLSKPTRRWHVRVLLWLSVGLALVALVFTYHRTALVTIGLQILLWTALNKRYGRAMLMVAAGALAVFWLRDWLQVLFSNAVDILEGEIALYDRAFLRGRGINWYLFLDSLFGSHPLFWLFGRGGSVAQGFVPTYGYWSSKEPHNDYIRILHAYGLFGLGLYVAILFSWLMQSRRLRRATGHFPRQ